MTKPGDQNGPHGFFQSTEGRLALLVVAIIILLVFVSSYVL